VSSAILYVAIVAIWIGVLVPRWLRHEHAHDGHLRLRWFSGGRQRAGDAAARAGFSEDGRPRYTSFGGDSSAERQQAGPAGVAGPQVRDAKSPRYDNMNVSAPVSGDMGDMAQPYKADVAPGPVRSYGWSAEEYLRQERGNQRAPRARRPGTGFAGSPSDPRADRDSRAIRGSRSDQHSRSDRDSGSDRGSRAIRDSGPGVHARPTRPAGDAGERPETAARERRARMLRGRRRMLWMLLVLAVAAVAVAYLQLAAWWIAVPPVVLLAGYLLLLREAAHADAEAHERQARERSAAMARHASEARQAHEARQATDTQRGTGTGSSPARPAYETLPRAEVIDISERVGDQLYDQYADAHLRAVGD
jgi:hypothetical protein